jgi:HNH endonuclease
MAFPSNVRREALERAHYTCVLCRRPGFLEVHHIVAAATGGEDTIENACPLCPQCHADFGANPERRNALREIRNWWWGHCSTVAQDRLAYELGERLKDVQTEMSLNLGQITQELKDLIRSELSQRCQAVDSEESLNAIAQIAEVSLPLRLAVYDAFAQVEKAVRLAGGRSGLDPSIIGIRNRVYELERDGQISSGLRQRFASLREFRDQVWSARESTMPPLDVSTFFVGVHDLVNEFNRVCQK